MKRKLLLIMPNFFDYPQAICEELEKMGGWGYEVDCFDDRPSTNGMVKAIIHHPAVAEPAENHLQGCRRNHHRQLRHHAFPRR